MDDFHMWTEELETYELPLLDRRRKVFRILALIVVIAIVLTLLIPVIIRVARPTTDDDSGTITVTPPTQPWPLLSRTSDLDRRAATSPKA